MLSKTELLLSVIIFGTIGLFRNMTTLPSSLIAFTRGITGAVFIFAAMLIVGKKPDFKAIKKNSVLLLVSGGAIGINWILLFEAYKYTSVATATVCYYLAPVIVVLVSPIFLNQKRKLSEYLLALLSFTGIFYISGVFGTAVSLSEMKGIILGLSDALVYAVIVILNYKITGISAYDKTVTQLFAAGITVLPYMLITVDFSAISIGGNDIFLLAVMGIVHTGIAYILYFDSLSRLSSLTVALFSYIDPVVAILCSVFLLGSGMSVYEIIGTVLILLPALVSEILNIYERKKPC